MSRLARWALGWLWWVVVPARKRVAMANLAQHAPNANSACLRRAVGTVAWGYVELWLGRDAVVEPAAALPAGGGVALMAHGGAWDLALVALGRRVPVTVFVREPSNPWAARFIAAQRRRSDLELLPPSGSMERATQALAEGRLVVFFQDQRHNDGIPVPFLDAPAWTSAGFAAMVWRQRPTVVGLWPRLGDDGRHYVDVEPLAPKVPEDRDAAIATLTQLSQDWTARHVVAHPDGWWWLHKRWKVPPAGPPG